MKLKWDQVGERVYETGTDHGVLYIPDANGVYNDGYAWNGLTAVTESPSGAESNPQYADNIKYVNITSAEEFGGTIEAFTYPKEFAQCNGEVIVGGVTIGQQGRKMFGMAYRTLIGNDTEGTDHGYKIHLVYGAQAAPSEKAYQTVNDSPEAMGFSWELTTTPVEVPGTNPVTGKPYKPTATLTIDSRDTPAANLQALEDILYGTEGADPRLPLPAEVLTILGAASITEVETQAPTYDAGTDIITIPTVSGVVYQVDGETVPAGAYGPITEDTVVTAVPAAGYSFTETSDTDWTINFA